MLGRDEALGLLTCDLRLRAVRPCSPPAPLPDGCATPVHVDEGSHAPWHACPAGVDEGYASPAEGYATASDGYASATESMASMGSMTSMGSTSLPQHAAARRAVAAADSDSDDEARAAAAPVSLPAPDRASVREAGAAP